MRFEAKSTLALILAATLSVCSQSDLLAESMNLKVQVAQPGGDPQVTKEFSLEFARGNREQQISVQFAGGTLDLSVSASGQVDSLGGTAHYVVHAQNNSMDTKKVSIWLRKNVTQQLNQVMLGGHATISGVPSIGSWQYPTVALHTNYSIVPNSVSNLTACEADCFEATFGNGNASVATVPFSGGFGTVVVENYAPSELRTVDTTLVFSNTALCADLDGDKAVGSSDLAILLGEFGNISFYNAYDLNQDYWIDSADLGVLLGDYGSCQ